MTNTPTTFWLDHFSDYSSITDTIYKGCLPHWKHPSQVQSVDAF